MVDVSANIERAAEMWGRGLTATQIAKALNITRNAVIGYANRNRSRFPRRKGGPEVQAANEQRIRKLEELWARGLTYRQMADAIGIENVGSLISANRERFPAREKPAKPKAEAAPPQPEPAPALPAEAVALPTKAEAFQPLPDAAPVLLWKAPTNACRWPIDMPAEGAQPHVCGCVATRGSYCAAHHALSIGAGTLWERTAHKDLLIYGRAA